MFDVPVGGVDTGWSRTWPDEHVYHVLGDPGSPFTALARDRTAVPGPPSTVARRYAAVLREAGWEGVTTSCGYSSPTGEPHAASHAWTVLEGEATTAAVRVTPGPTGVRVEVTVSVHGGRGPGVSNACPCPSSAG